MDTQVVYNPATLCQRCLDVCVTYPYESLISHEDNACMDIDTDDDDEVLSTENYTGTLELRNHMFLPDNLCEILFQRIIRQHHEQYMQAFVDTEKCRLSKLNLSRLSTKDILHDQQIIMKLFRHPLREINLSECKMVPNTLSALRYCAKYLKILNLSSVSGLKNFLVLKDLRNLVKLNLQGTDIGFRKEHMTYVGSLPKLAWLDLSHTSVDDSSLDQLSGLAGTLTWLSLYNCVHITDEAELVNLITKLKHLVHLDLSKNPSQQNSIAEDSKNTPYPVVNTMILETCSTLKSLVSLDISGSSNLKLADLNVLSSSSCKLKFLGLCNTGGLSYNSPLPAEKITGEANEEQILTSLDIYMDRKKYVSMSLRKLFSLASHHGCQQIERCLRLILKSMKTFKDDNSIHIAATASLYHLSREEVQNQDPQLRRDIIVSILESMENLKGVLQLQKNSCLTLCNFKIPIEVEFQYYRVAELLLTALRNHPDDYLRRIAIMLFNAIVCQSQNAGIQKREIGLRGAIQTIIQVIREKLEANQSDALMETCWSSLWNITDETPENCLDFLNQDGMSLFVDCLNLFPDSQELHRNMMGLMGNVAEVDSLRPMLMKEEYIDLFTSLLSHDTSFLEVSYNSAGLLSHILSDGEQAWKVTNILRDECMHKIINCIDSWDINSSRNINYRSFKPILELLHCYSAPAAQHWAAWALANLTKVYPFKYCKLVQEENGINILEEVINSCETSLRVKELSTMVIKNCKNELCFS